MPADDYSGPVVARIVALVQPILDDLGLVLYDCEHAGGTVTITVDKDRGDEDGGDTDGGEQVGGVLLDELALVTRLVSRELDHDDPVPGRYTLEVSSPGLERRLRRPDHFAGAVGAPVTIRLTHQVDGLRRVDGVLLAADDRGVTIRADDPAIGERTVAYADIERAKTVFSWGPPPKPGKGPAKRSTPTARRRASDTTDDHTPTTHTQEAAAS